MEKPYKIGLFPMCADILHAGHIMALQEAKEKCDKLVVALNTHPDGKSPIQSVYERYVQLKGCKYIDEIIPYQGKTDMRLICSTFNYDVRFVGMDYRDKAWDGKVEEEFRDIPVEFLPRRHNLSSTELKERIKKGEQE